MIFLLLPTIQGAVSVKVVFAWIIVVGVSLGILINLCLFVFENYRPQEGAQAARPQEGAQAARNAGGTHPINEHADL
jgi:hypothetical protein